MTGWLLDTNILSELRRPKPEAKVVEFIAGQALDLLYVSSATFAELRSGIELVENAARRAESIIAAMALRHGLFCRVSAAEIAGGKAAIPCE